MAELKIPEDLAAKVTKKQMEILSEGMDLAAQIVAVCRDVGALNEKYVFNNYTSRLKHLGGLSEKELEKEIGHIKKNIDHLNAEFQRGVWCQTAKDMMFEVLYRNAWFMI